MKSTRQRGVRCGGSRRTIEPDEVGLRASRDDSPYRACFSVKVLPRPMRELPAWWRKLVLLIGVRTRSVHDSRQQTSPGVPRAHDLTLSACHFFRGSAGLSADSLRSFLRIVPRSDPAANVSSASPVGRESKQLSVQRSDVGSQRPRELCWGPALHSPAGPAGELLAVSARPPSSSRSRPGFLPLSIRNSQSVWCSPPRRPGNCFLRLGVSTEVGTPRVRFFGGESRRREAS